MATTIITSDSVPAILAQLAEQQDQLAATVDALAGQLADQAVANEQQDEALRVQAMALRTTAAQLSRNISDAAKAARQSSSGGNGNGNGANSANRTGDDNRRQTDNSADDDNSNSGRAGNDRRDKSGRTAAGNPGRADLRAVGNPGRAAVKPVAVAAAKPNEPSPPERKRAHRWI